MDILIDQLPVSHGNNDLLWTFKDRPDLFAKFTQYAKEEHNIVKEDVSQDVAKDLGKKTSRTKKTSPMHIIISLSDNNIINQDYINDQLKAFISKPEFQKVFGIKKTSEIMKGLTENKWNKSLVLFLSFLFEKPFVYLAKDVTYYPDKEYNDIDKIVI
jgi:hypothetical protein